MTTTGTKVASKYMLGPKIGSGSFGQVYVVHLIGTSQILALKREDDKSKSSQIAVEYRILKQMQNVEGYAQVHWHGSENKYNLMVMDMLGPSLEDLFEICGKSFSLKTTIMIADQMIQRIEELHNHNYIHRDIKPENFLMGLKKNSHLVHIIDFGLSKKYRDSKTMQHIPYKENKNLTGTARYASLNAHLGIEQSRRDDLEAIGYVMLYFRQGFLPWQGIKANNKNQKYQKIMEKKMSIPIEVQCKGLPLEISTYISYCRSLKLNDKPDYAFLRRMLLDLFEREGYKYDYCYDWTILKESKSLDNGKIRLELKVSQTHKKETVDLMIQSRASEMSKSKPTLVDNIQQDVKKMNYDSDEDDLIMGQENIEEGIIVQQEHAYEKKVDLLMDLEEKRNNLMDEESENFIQ